MQHLNLICFALVLMLSQSSSSRTTDMKKQPVVTCPTITLNAPDEYWKLPLTFTAEVTGADSSRELIYKWSVSKEAHIRKGQGTRSITIELDEDAKPQNGSFNLTVTVKVEGLEPSCPNEATARISIFFD